MTIDLQKIQALKEKKDIGFFRFKKLNAKTYLITNDIGKYAYLNEDEFSDFISGNIKEGLRYNELKEKHFIKSSSYKEEMADAFAQKNRYLSYGPTLHIVVTTLRCNHKCQYCHAAVAPMTAKNLDMTMETAKKVLDTIFYTSSPNLTIEFQWGESLVNWEVVKYFVEQAEVKAMHLAKNVTLALVTNLSLMDEEKMNYLIDHNVHISTSLDGDEVVHNSNRTYKDDNSFEKVTYWIRRINEEYKKDECKMKQENIKKLELFLLSQR